MKLKPCIGTYVAEKKLRAEFKRMRKRKSKAEQAAFADAHYLAALRALVDAGVIAHESEARQAAPEEFKVWANDITILRAFNKTIAVRARTFKYRDLVREGMTLRLTHTKDFKAFCRSYRKKILPPGCELDRILAGETDFYLTTCAHPTKENELVEWVLADMKILRKAWAACTDPVNEFGRVHRFDNAFATFIYNKIPGLKKKRKTPEDATLFDYGIIKPRKRPK